MNCIQREGEGEKDIESGTGFGEKQTKIFVNHLIGLLSTVPSQKTVCIDFKDLEKAFSDTATDYVFTHSVIRESIVRLPEG